MEFALLKASVLFAVTLLPRSTIHIHRCQYIHSLYYITISNKNTNTQLFCTLSICEAQVL